jgi:hypothetical protein
VSANERKCVEQPKLTELVRLAFKRNYIRALFNVKVVYIAKNIAPFFGDRILSAGYE